MEAMDTQSDMITLASGEAVRVGQIVEFAGQECKVCRNGALMNMETKRFVTPPAPAFRLEPVRTTEGAIALNNARWHAPRQAAAIAAVREAAGNDSLDTIEHVDGYLMQAMISEIVLNQEVRADHRIKAYEMVLEQSGMDGRAPKQAHSEPSGGIQPIFGVDIDALERLIAALKGANG